MIAVSDTGPLHYLVLIDCSFVLEELFERVLIPQAVSEELHHDRTPPLVQRWVDDPPDWLEVVSIETPPPLNGLGRGEWEAITLAESVPQNTILLLDDQPGRIYAEQRGIRAVGTLGLLVRASQLQKLDLRDAVERLVQTNFGAHSRLIRSLFEDE